MQTIDRQKVSLMMRLLEDHKHVSAFTNALNANKTIKVAIDIPDISNNIIRFFRGQQHKGIQWYNDACKSDVTWFKIDPNEDFNQFILSKLGKAETTAPELTGLSVNYYQVAIDFPTTEGRQPYTAECNDIIEALGMTPAEANIFKETWRTAASRTLGKKKTGHTALYAYEKIFFFAKRQYELFKFNLNKSGD